MSKAFTKESDDEAAVVLPPRESTLPEGAPNYATPAGAKRLRDELQHMQDNVRPVALKRASEPDTRSAAGPSVLEIDRRIAALQESLARMEIVDPTRQDPSRVLFGATVTVRDEHEHEHRYRIVGADDADARRGWISWAAPLARALLGHRAGESVAVRSPRGEEELEIVRIEYEAD